MIEHDVIEQEIHEERRRKARVPNGAKARFLANMSHDIRTPLNGILGMTELALQATSLEEQREYLGIIRSSGDALLALLNHSLELSQTEEGKPNSNESAFSLRELIHEISQVFEFRMREKGLKLELVVAQSVPDSLKGNTIQLRRILLELVSNGMKFASSGLICFHVNGKQHGDYADLVFSAGNGGVDPHAITFSVSIQLKLAPQLTPLVVDAAPQVAKQQEYPMNILLAEDNPVNQTLAVRMLSKQGHHVTVASNGAVAVEQFRKETFDLILMDVQMPEMDGLAATREIRRLENGSRRIPIIAMTAQTLKGDRERCFASGMDAFVAKPVRPPDLWAAIDNVRVAADNERLTSPQQKSRQAEPTGFADCSRWEAVRHA